MRAFHSSSALLIALLVSACSSDDDAPATASGGTTQTSVVPNNPAGAGGGGSAPGPSAAAGSGTTSAGGSEGATPDIPLNTAGGAANAPASSNGEGGSAIAAAGAGGAAVVGGAAGAGDEAPVADAGEAPAMSFFVTSRGGPDGGNFGGLDGADAFCTELATAANPANGARTWHAYLSTADENARDRIGTGPWRNFEGRIIANNLEQLHDQSATGTLNATWPLGDASVALDETGAEVVVPTGVVHDILTGTLANGTIAPDHTCSDWTAATGLVQVGHSNRAGGGVRESWTSAHDNVGCSPATRNGEPMTVSSGGGRGSIYCFAID